LVFTGKQGIFTGKQGIFTGKQGIFTVDMFFYMLFCNDKKLDKYLNVITIKGMKIEFDPNKSEKNGKERNLSFDRAVEFDWASALIIPDGRKDYFEERYVAVGYLDGRLHIICFTPIKNGMRIISFRKANKREADKYEKNITIDG